MCWMGRPLRRPANQDWPRWVVRGHANPGGEGGPVSALSPPLGISRPARLLGACPRQNLEAPIVQGSARGPSRCTHKPRSWLQPQRWDPARGNEGRREGSRAHWASAARKTSGAGGHRTKGTTCEIKPLWPCDQVTAGTYGPRGPL